LTDSTRRAAINFGNPILAGKDPATGEPRGVSVDLSRELARRLGVPVQFVLYDDALLRHRIEGAAVGPRTPVE
jgi:polar amino acid transport system substrate-binding protein